MMANQNKSEPEKLDLASLDLSIEKRAELLRLFPEARTEKDKIDFDQLKRALGMAVDSGKERYGLVWPGKADCFKTIQAPSLATLRPAPDESVNFDTTENLIIEGDNLEVLKLLQKSYLGRVKMIYIDPPYNTGNDFIYPDNYAESLQTYLQYTGQMDAEGRKFGTNTEVDGRFHSKWLNMMYPRLYLARNLLRDDGVIFVTADNQEEDNLKKICQEIFGEENYVTTVVWQKKVSPANDAKWFSSDHDYIRGGRANSDSWISGVSA
jgi:adenine-specific DNA-methyltransferase